MRVSGFSLLELTIAIAVLSLVMIMMFAVMASSTESITVADAKGLAQTNVRDVLDAMTREIQLAAKTEDDSLVPELNPLSIVLNPAPNSPVEVVFQIPADASGEVYTTPIRYRYLNEDANNNGRLDAGEDADGDGLLTRRIVRIQDLNGDGDTADNGEERIVAGSNDLANVQFALLIDRNEDGDFDDANERANVGNSEVNGDILEMVVTSTRPMGMRQNLATAQGQARVYLLN